MEQIEKIDITELLPQQRPFVMVDSLAYFDETSISTKLLVKSDNIFVEGEFLTEPGIVENIAQTGAARMGYVNKYIQKDEVKLGFIGEVKNLVIERNPRVGEELLTTVTIVKEVLSTLLVQAQVKVGETLIASGEMKIFMTDIAGQAS
ncbi:MAG: pseudouridylate synthase [Bacteroidales bacterium]|jgi:3-hydroxymyristoyl/3-hydroxydecanoyl-(acyl carrier protein) dehydratase|nr:pseudouridylate synthase [Bacteroidales bacterium]